MARSRHKRKARTILGLIGVLGFASYMLWALRVEDSIRVISKKLEQTAAGIVVSGEIYNASEATTSVNIEVSFYSHTGQKLADEVVELQALPVGGSAPFRTQPRKIANVKDYSIYINSGRNMYGN